MTRPVADQLLWRENLSQNQPIQSPVITSEADSLSAPDLTPITDRMGDAANRANADYIARQRAAEEQARQEEMQRQAQEAQAAIQQQIDQWYEDSKNQYAISFDQQNQKQIWEFEDGQRHSAAEWLNHSQQQMLMAQGGGIGPALIPPFVSSTEAGLRMAITGYAQQFVGIPYEWGGTNLDKGVDCSGLIQSVYKQFGINMPRIANDQAYTGVKTSISNLVPGDLVAWNNGMVSGQKVKNGVGHIAIYLGNGKILEAPQPGASVHVRDLRKNENIFGVHFPNLNANTTLKPDAPRPRTK